MLPACFLPDKTYDLIRVGSPHDGGYLVEKNSIYQSSKLISLGISTNWTFDEAFVSLHPVPVDAYDHSIFPRFWKRFSWNALGDFLFAKGYGVGRFLESVFLYKKFEQFFSGSRTHFPKKVGSYASDGIQLSTILSQEQNPVFLKVDIESSEYRILDQIIDYELLISGLVIEFHDIDLHRERIVDFMTRTSLTLVHTHPNNFDTVDANGDPLVIEMTFAKNPVALSNATPVFPHRADALNDPLAPDIVLKFKN